MATFTDGQVPTINGLPVIPTFFPIDTSGITDVSKVPIFDTMRGDIVPAQLDSSDRIINHPTPFYIFCASKVINTGNTYQTLPRVNILTPEAYIQFGLTQGSGEVFPATNASGNNIAYKNQFTLTNFSKAFTSGVFENNEEESAGLLVPVYCVQNPTLYNPTSKDRINNPSFIFFRADVFWDTTTDSNPYNASRQIPDKPINYQSPSFPSPIGKSFANFFLLSSYYSTSGDADFLTGTWSQFMPFALINAINAPVGGANYFKNGPAAALVSIAFNDPFDGIGIKSGTNVNFYPVNILRSSTIYTVYYINQTLTPNSNSNKDGYANFIQKYYVPFDDPTNQDPIRRNYGFPLNFIYQVGGDTFSKTQNFETYYQSDEVIPYSNYLGTITQWGTGALNPESGGDGWNLAGISFFFRNNFSFVFNSLTERGALSLAYNCNCESTSPGTSVRQYVNNMCAIPDGGAPSSENGYPRSFRTGFNLLGLPTDPGIFINGTVTRADNSLYYGSACSTIHLGTYNFNMFQFVPINYFNTPRKGAVPPIFSPQDPIPPGSFKGEVARTGEIGIPATFGPGPTGLPGTDVPVYIPGPTGAGPFSISYPFNTQTGASNNWPTLSEPSNRIQNIDLTNTLEAWMDNPLNFQCPRLLSSQTYCGFQDYYHSLQGVFYDKPQNLPVNAECGDFYVPPIDNLITSSIKYTPFGCTGPKICVPNYDFLNDTTDPSKKAFYCQDPAEAAPFPESTNGFNNTNSYTIDNFNYTLLPPFPDWDPYPPLGAKGIKIQPTTYTPITWDNLNTYTNLIPVQVVPAELQEFTQVPFVPKINSVNPQTGKVEPKGNTVPYLIISIVALVILVFIVVFFIYYSAKSKDKDMRNPYNFQYYNRVI